MLTKKKTKCSEPFCRSHNIKAKGLCSKHYTRKRRNENPLKSSYQALKDNAKRRGKDFSLTLEEFKKFAIETGYVYGRGRTVDSFHIDRIDESKGYHIENIQILTNSENVKKFHKIKRILDYHYDPNGVPCYFHFKGKSEYQTEFKNGAPF